MKRDTFGSMLKHVYCEPKFVARMEWSRDYSIGAQIMGQIGRPALERYVSSGKWENPDATVSIEVHEAPDFDWWEPRHDQPWRRQAARDRGESA